MSKARDLADSAQEINILDGKSFLDEDNLASDSATGIASQQSIKAYVDGVTTTNITSTGALNSGSITSGFGNINNGSSTITTTGAISGGSFVIGSADINENDLESIDGITAGTVAASKAVVVNANKDITGFRNLTATGNISGTLSGAISSTTTATTQAESDDSTKVATTAYVVDKITTLIGGAPSTLNDLNELAAAINDDANYNSTLTTALGTKLPLAGGTMTGDVLYNDNVKAKFGAGSDLEIYSDGTHSYLKETGSGNLWIGGANIGLGNPSASEYFVECVNNGAVQLYHNNQAKLATTSSGIAVTGNIANSGDLTLDVAGDITLDADGGDIRFKDGGTEVGAIVMDDGSNTLIVQATQNDADIKFTGKDNNSGITALTLDMSDAGHAKFNSSVSLVDNAKLNIGTGSDLQIYHDGSNSYILDQGVGNLNISGNDIQILNAASNEAMAYFAQDGGVTLYHNGASKLATTSSGIAVTGNIANSGDLTLDVAGDIILDAGGGDIFLKQNGTHYGSIKRNNGDLQIHSEASDEDILFVGNDGGSVITALTLDMSAAGAATFNAGVTATTFNGDGSNLTGVGGSTTVGAVGTYVLAWTYLYANRAIGTTIAGNQLRAGGLAWRSNSGNISINGDMGVNTNMGSGTYQFMSSTANMPGHSYYTGGLWVRIS